MSSKKQKANSINIGINDGDREKIVKGLSALLADSYTPVSYTHLDVYKRQEFPPGPGGRPQAEGNLLHPRRRLRRR